jgi:hypothetical protein
MLEWAEKRGKSFVTADAAKHLRLSRPHASMVLSRLANGSTAIRRVQRGVFVFGEAAAAAAAQGAAAATGHREGTIPARVIAWAEKRRTTFATADIERQFDLKRAHASMVLSTLAREGGIRRVRRGVFAASGANVAGGAPAATAAATPAKTRRGRRATAKAPREGSLPARVLEWAAARGKPFGNGDIEKKFKLSRPHASMLTSTLAKGPHPIERTGRGVYAYVGDRAAAAPRKTTKKRRK